jgi:hypothetical protein
MTFFFFLFFFYFVFFLNFVFWCSNLRTTVACENVCQAFLEQLSQTNYLQGMLDGQFAQIQALQDASSPKFVTEVIIIFCNDAERIILELNKYM